MKKIFYLLGIIGLLSVSCTEKGSKPTPPLSPDEQKEKIELVGMDLMDKYPARAFEDFFDLSGKFAEKYFDYDYDWDDFYEYCEEKGEELYKWTEDEWYEDGKDYYEYSTEVLVLLSNLQGKLTLGSHSAKCTDYDGLKVLFDVDGNDYEADLTFSGKTTTAYYSYKDVYGNNDSYYGNDYHCEDTYNIEVEVPEKITISVTENGKSFAEISIQFMVSFSKTGVNLTKDCFLVTTTIKIDEHELILSNTGYDASMGKAMAGLKIKCEGEVVLSAELSGSVDIELVEEDVDPDSEEGYYDNEMWVECSAAKNIKIDIDILGQLQVKGSCSNVMTLMDHMENLWGASNDSAAERAADNINNLLDLGIYFDGSSSKQADLVMDYYLYEDYWGDEFYEIEPIIEFSDGSKYAFYEYFNEDDFEDLIDTFELWIEKYFDLVDYDY